MPTKVYTSEQDIDDCPLAEKPAICSFYIDFIRNVVRDEVRAKLKEALSEPIELTHEDIEKAFGCRVKIVENDTAK